MAIDGAKALGSEISYSGAEAKKSSNDTILQLLAGKLSQKAPEKTIKQYVVSLNKFQELDSIEQKAILSKLSIEDMLDLLDSLDVLDPEIMQELNSRFRLFQGLFKKYTFLKPENIISLFKEIRSLSKVRDSCFYGRSVGDILALFSYYEKNKDIDSLLSLFPHFVRSKSVRLIDLANNILCKIAKQAAFHTKVKRSLERNINLAIALGYTGIAISLCKITNKIVSCPLVLGKNVVQELLYDTSKSITDKVEALKNLSKVVNTVRCAVVVKQKGRVKELVDINKSKLVIVEQLIEKVILQDEERFLVVLQKNIRALQKIKIQGQSCLSFSRLKGSPEMAALLSILLLNPQEAGVDISSFSFNRDVLYEKFNKILELDSGNVFKKKILEFLLHNSIISCENADLNSRNSTSLSFNVQNSTPLEQATMMKSIPLINLLLKLGADPMQGSVIGGSLFDSAIVSGSMDMFSYYLKKIGLPLNVKDGNDLLLIDRAILCNNYKAAFLLSLYGYHTKIEHLQELQQHLHTKDMFNLILRFVDKAVSIVVSKKVLEIFVKAKMIDLNPSVDGSYDINSRNEKNVKWSIDEATPVEQALFRKDKSLLQVLVSLGADVNKGSVKGLRPIKLALSKGDRESILELVSHGAEIRKEEQLEIERLLKIVR